MDLKDFYFQNIQGDEYHYRFYDSIENVNKIFNIFSGYEEVENYEFEVYDTEEAITKFRELCQPEVSFSRSENICWFYLLSYYLYKVGYVIKEFPRLLARPPIDLVTLLMEILETELLNREMMIMVLFDMLLEENLLQV